MEYIRIGSRWGDNGEHDIFSTFIDNNIVFVGLKDVENYKKLYNSHKKKVIVVTSGKKVVAIGYTSLDFDNLTNFSERKQIEEDLDYDWFTLANYILAIKVELFLVEEDFPFYRGKRIHIIKSNYYKRKIDTFLEKIKEIK